MHIRPLMYLVKGLPGNVGIDAPSPEAWLLILLGLMLYWRLDTRSAR